MYQIESNIITGKTPPTKDKTNYGNDVPFITIGDIRDNKYVVNTELKLSAKGADSQETKYLPAGSLCVTCIASPSIMGFSTENSQTNQQINSIVFSKTYNKEYLYCYLRRYFNQHGSVKTGNTFANMNKDDFSNILIIYPPKNILKAFYSMIEPHSSQIEKLSIENKQLMALRNWLLPMLMNGQATIAD